MKEEKIKVIIKRVDAQPELTVIQNNLGKAWFIVCGDIEIVRLEKNVLLVCNENGKMLRMTPNFGIARGMNIGVRGNVFFCTVDSEGEFASLTAEQVVYVFDLLKESRI